MALLGLMAVAFFWERSAMVGLRAQNESLRAENAEAGQLAGENRELEGLRAAAGTTKRTDRTELLRLRNEVRRLRVQQQEVEKLREANQRVAEEIKAGKFTPRRLADMEGAVPREERVVAVHAAAIISNANLRFAAVLNLYIDAGRSGVECIFNQFFDDRGGALDNFSRGDLIGERIGENADPTRHECSVGQLAASRLDSVEGPGIPAGGSRQLLVRLVPQLGRHHADKQAPAFRGGIERGVNRFLHVATSAEDLVLQNEMQRRLGRGLFSDLSFPGERSEDWRFTNVAPLLRVPFALADAGHSDIRLPPLPTPGAVRLVFVNGLFSPEQSRLSATPGLAVGSLRPGSSEEEGKEEKLTVSGSAHHAECFPRSFFDRSTQPTGDQGLGLPRCCG